jgi:single-stranded DNA-binding protein
MLEVPQVRIAGELVYTPELRFTPSGRALCTFDVIADTGQSVKCELWEELGEGLANLGLLPGTRIGMQGGFRNRKHQDGKFRPYFVVNQYAVAS